MDENQGKFMIKETRVPGYQGKWEKGNPFDRRRQILELGGGKNEPVQLPWVRTDQWH